MRMGPLGPGAASPPRSFIGPTAQVAVLRNGNVTLRADVESRHQLQGFNDCYRKAVRARIDQRAQAGLAVPGTMHREPSAEVD